MRADVRILKFFMVALLGSVLVYRYGFQENSNITDRDDKIDHPEKASKSNTETSDSTDRPTSDRRLTDALLIGVSKCGSTALMFFLKLNPHIRALVSEIEYLCDEDNFAKGLDFYYSKLPKDVNPDEVIVERDGTCWRKNYAERVYSTYKSLQKQLKIILVACDPVYRAVSWYVHGKNNPASKIAKLNKTFIDVAFDSETGDVNPAYDGIRAATYDVGFEQWLQYFPLEQMHVVDGDILKKDPYVELHEVETFLGVQNVISRDHLYFNETKGYFCKRLKVGGDITCMPPYKGRKHPSLDQDVESKLREYFAPHDAQFQKLTGKEFSWTNKRKE